jgi:predicted RNA-binding Zn-ribbon protein involved in translation (DUF1610 family)
MGELSRQSSRPHVERTPFDPVAPPERVTLYYCPACGQRITRDYGVEPARKRCTAHWHLAEGVAVTYVREARNG